MFQRSDVSVDEFRTKGKHFPPVKSIDRVHVAYVGLLDKSIKFNGKNGSCLIAVVQMMDNIHAKEPDMVSIGST